MGRKSKSTEPLPEIKFSKDKIPLSTMMKLAVNTKPSKLLSKARAKKIFAGVKLVATMGGLINSTATLKENT